VKKNTSPWLHQLDKNRVAEKLHKDIETDIAIVGAGIAGVSSAFFILKNTKKSVVLLERFRLAHGATGHNAGQVVSYFERGFASLVEEFGANLARQGQKDVEDAWKLLDEMYTDAGLDISFSRFIGHAGIVTYEQLLWHLKNNFERERAGLNTEHILVSETAGFIEKIPTHYRNLYSTTTLKNIQSMLETDEEKFIATVSYQKGCVNSALFCQEILLYLLTEYQDRFSFYEHTPVHKIILRQEDAVLDAEKHTVAAKRVVLCTNGFESLHILNETGLDIDAKYHHLLSGKIGYMSGYLEKMNKPPTAVSYLTDPTIMPTISYFYLTRRPYEYEKNSAHNLISVGGPDVNLEEKTPYSHEDDYPDEMGETIDQFVRSIYDTEPNKKIDYIFTWHGLMGYTKNRVRFIGQEPKNHVLLYNLGCNGIGILPSIHGGKKIADVIEGKKVGKSIFDVPAR